jgi:iron complex outermembrane receptor protein
LHNCIARSEAVRALHSVAEPGLMLRWQPCTSLLFLAAVSLLAESAAAEVIEEIIVTAQKREQSLQHVPFSVTAITGEDIQDAGIEDIFDVAGKVPSLEITQNDGPINTSFRIRRIGNEANIPNFEPAVGLFVDGAFRARSGVGIGDLIDLNRIEVLRGPQNTLYGKNTSAGVINIITRKPTEEFEFLGELTAGVREGGQNANHTIVSASVNGPLGDNVRGRLSGSIADRGETTVNLFNGDDSDSMNRYSVRAQLLLEPIPELELRLTTGIFRITDSHSVDPEFFEGVIPQFLNTSLGVPCPVNDPNDRKICLTRAVVLDMDVADVTLTADYGFDDYELTSITSYESYESFRNGDVDQMNIQVLDFFDRQDSESISQELRLASSNGDRLTWLAGLYYFKNEFDYGDPVKSTFLVGADGPALMLAPGIAFGQPGYSGFLDSRTETDHLSVFAQAVWHFPDFELTIGGRWQSEDKKSSIANSADHTDPSVITLVLSPEAANATLQRDTDDLTWAVSGQYFLSEDSMLYATASNGFKSGGFNAGFGNTPVADREFRDETVTHLEIGAKTTLMDQRLQLNAALFSTDYNDYQAASFISLQFLVNNADKVSLRGVELDGIALLSDALTGTFGVSWVDAEYAKYTEGSCYPGKAPDNMMGTACVLSGETLPFAPRIKTTLGLQFERTTRLGGFYARMDWTWTDSYNSNTNLDPRHVQDAFSLINLRTGLRFDNYDISLWIDNVADETWVMQDAISNLFGTDPAFQRYLGKPRTYGVTVRFGI